MDTISKYLNCFECYKPLPADAIKVLVSKAKKGDKCAVSEIIYSHQKFIIYTAKKFGFLHNNISEDALMDIISAGNVGLLEAINRYDSTKDIPFLACAEFGIRNALGKNAYETRNGIYLPVAKAKKLSTVKKFIVNYGNGDFTENMIVAAANEFGVTIEEIKEILSWNSQIIALEKISDNGKHSLDTPSYDHSESITEEIDKESMEKLLFKAIDELSNRQKFIICQHFGINCKKRSLSEIGKILMLSKQRVAQIEKESFSLLRESNYGKALLEFVA